MISLRVISHLKTKWFLHKKRGNHMERKHNETDRNDPHLDYCCSKNLCVTQSFSVRVVSLKIDASQWGVVCGWVEEWWVTGRSSCGMPESDPILRSHQCSSFYGRHKTLKGCRWPLKDSISMYQNACFDVQYHWVHKKECTSRLGLVHMRTRSEHKCGDSSTGHFRTGNNDQQSQTRSAIYRLQWCGENLY